MSDEPEALHVVEMADSHNFVLEHVINPEPSILRVPITIVGPNGERAILAWERLLPLLEPDD